MPEADLVSKVRKVGLEAGLGQAEVDRAMGKIMGALSSVASAKGAAGQVEGARMLAGLDSNLSDNPMLVAWGLSVAAKTSDRVFSRFVDNFLLGMVFDRKPVVDAMGYHPPITLVINPTMRCNLRCTGCYAFSYGQKTDMDRELLENVLDQARELGIAFITVTGGEPFL